VLSPPARSFPNNSLTRGRGKAAQPGRQRTDEEILALGSDEEDLVVGSEDGAGELGLGSSSADSKAAAGAPRGPAFIATSGSKSQLITASKATDAKATSVAALTSAASKETTAGNRTAGGKQTTAAIRGGAQGAGIGKVTIPAENSGGGGFPAANRNITKTAAGAKTLGLAPLTRSTSPPKPFKGLNLVNDLLNDFDDDPLSSPRDDGHDDGWDEGSGANHLKDSVDDDEFDQDF